jgi:hypothetical protein
MIQRQATFQGFPFPSTRIIGCDECAEDERLGLGDTTACVFCSMTERCVCCSECWRLTASAFIQDLKQDQSKDFVRSSA